MKRLILMLISLLACKPRAGEQHFRKSPKIIIVDDTVINSGNIQKIIEPVWWSVEIHEGEAVYNNDLKKFSTAQRQIFAIEWYIAEVNNGGHDQFYLNSTGLVWEDALNGLKSIGAYDLAAILEESTKRLVNSPSKDRAKRIEQLERFKPKFADLDERFFSAQKSLEPMMAAYAKKHRSEFYFNGEVQIIQP